jgi:hypothetical protein
MTEDARGRGSSSAGSCANPGVNKTNAPIKHPTAMALAAEKTRGLVLEHNDIIGMVRADGDILFELLISFCLFVDQCCENSLRYLLLKVPLLVGRPKSDLMMFSFSQLLMIVHIRFIVGIDGCVGVFWNSGAHQQTSQLPTRAKAERIV